MFTQALFTQARHVYTLCVDSWQHPLTPAAKQHRLTTFGWEQCDHLQCRWSDPAPSHYYFFQHPKSIMTTVKSKKLLIRAVQITDGNFLQKCFPLRKVLQQLRKVCRKVVKICTSNSCNNFWKCILFFNSLSEFTFWISLVYFFRTSVCEILVILTL